MILGFRSESYPSFQLPLIMQEKLVSPFRFYRDEKILEGVNFKHEFYGLVEEFEINQRLQVYQLAWALAEKKVPIILTTSNARLGIWIRLRSPAYAVWLNYAPMLPKILLRLHSMLHRLNVVLPQKAEL